MPRLLVFALIALVGCSGPQVKLPVGTSADSDAPRPTVSTAPPPARAASPEATGATGLRSHTVVHDGTARGGVLFVPETDGRAAPLVLLLHGFGGTGADFATEHAGLLSEAERRGWIVAVPDGSPCEGTEGYCWRAREGEFVPVSTGDDLAFLRALVADIRGTLPVDGTRVFVAGFSNGASMAHRVAAEAPDLVAAGAAVAGTVGRENIGLDGPPTGQSPSWTMMPDPTAPVPMLVVHGFEGRHTGYSDLYPIGPDFNTVITKYDFNYWAQYNGCEIGKERTENYGGSLQVIPNGGFATLEHRETCAERTLTRLIYIDKQGYMWPTAADGYNADTEILTFFDEATQ